MLNDGVGESVFVGTRRSASAKGPPPPYLSGQLVTGCQIDFVPFLPSERNVGGLATILHTAWVGRTDDGLHMGGVAKDPGNRNGCIGYTFDRRYLVDFLVEFWEFRIIQEN